MSHNEGLTYFISDLHLGASYIPDPKAHERMVVKWLRSIAPTAARIYLLGDVLDYWYEYKSVVPRGYVRFLGTLAELADSGIKITWFIGNHDIWIFDYIPTELGIRVVDGYCVEEICGKRFFLSHGDGIGHVPLSFKLMRGIFRNRICQRLFASVHPRWTVGLAYAWSAHNRRKHKQPGKTAAYRDKKLNGDTLLDFASEYMTTHPQDKIDWFVFGHYHVLSDRPVPGTDAHVVILGDWISHMSYAVFDGKNLRLEQEHVNQKYVLQHN